MRANVTVRLAALALLGIVFTVLDIAADFSVPALHPFVPWQILFAVFFVRV